MFELPRIQHRTVQIGDVEVFYRESIPERADAPILLLLHGFPRDRTNSARCSKLSARTTA